MPSLAFCLKKLKIQAAEADYLTKRTKAYKDTSGMSQEEADATVLKEWIKELEKEYGSIIDQVQQQGLKAPKKERRKYDAYTQEIWNSLIDKIESVKEARKIMKELLRKVYTDALTGIGSRAGFFEQLAQDERLPINQRRNIVLIDLDNFSFFNDILGHGTGDEVLKAVGRALQKFGVDAYRIGGEEFGLLIKDDKEAAQAAMNIQEALEEAVVIRQQLRQPRKLDKEAAPYGIGEELTIEGVGVSYGIDKIYDRADAKLQDEKASREKEGIRAKKGTEIKRLRRRGAAEAGKGAEGKRLQREGVFTQFSVTPGLAEEDYNIFNQENWNDIAETAKPPVQLEFKDLKMKSDEDIEGLRASQKTGMETTGRLKAGALSVKTPAQAASLIAHIGNAAQENYYLIPVTKRGRVIEVHRYTKGLLASAPGRIADIVGYAMNIGADHIYLAHNHPGGGQGVSPEDWAMVSRVDAGLALEGIGSTHFIISKDKYVVEDTDAMPRDIPKAVRNKSLKVKERVYLTLDPMDEASTSVDAIMVKNRLFGEDIEGLMLQDAHNRVIGFFEWPVGKESRQGAAEIIKAIERTNAMSGIFFGNTDMTATNLKGKRELESRYKFFVKLRAALYGEFNINDFISDGKSLRDNQPNAELWQRLTGPATLAALDKPDLLLSTPREEVPTFAQAFSDKWKKRGVAVDIYEGDKIDLQNIIVPKGKRKQGIGSEIMNELIDYADRVGKRIELTPATKDDYHGTTSRNRLIKFYKRFGFVHNVGRNKDFTTAAGMYRQPLVNRPEAMPPESTAFKKWFGKSKVVDADGVPLMVLHGSTHSGINVYRTNDGELLGDVDATRNSLGPGAYFTNDPVDANENYAGIGPDLEGKIGNAMDNYQDLDRWAEEDILRGYFTRNAMTEELAALNEATVDDKGWEYDNEPLQVFLDEHWDDALKSHLHEEMVGDAPGGMIYPAYLKMENPLDVDEHLFDYEVEWDEETGDVVSEGGPAEDFINEIINVIISGFETDGMVTDLRNELYQQAMDSDGLTAADAMEAMDRTLYVISTPDTGQYVSSGMIIRIVAEERMGFDGLIMNAYKHFGPKNMAGITTRGMPGLAKDTTHYLPFNPNQIKSAIGNVGTFDKNNDDIRFSVGHGYGQQMELPFARKKKEFDKTRAFDIVQPMRVKLPGLEPFMDGMSGINQEAALARAGWNWPDAESIEPVGPPIPHEDKDRWESIIENNGVDALSLQDAADPDLFFMAERLAEKKWPDVPFEETRFFKVNNRVHKELVLFELLFGPSEKAIEVPGVGRVAARSIMPSDLLQDMYRVVETGELADILNRKNDPMEIALSRGLSKRSPGKLPNGKRMRSPAEDFAHILNKVRRVNLLMPVDEKGKPYLTDNSKAGASADLLLAFCDPTEQCIVCYAAASMVREDTLIKSFRNSFHLLADPDGYATQLAMEAAALRRPDYPFLRLLGSGDFVTIEQVKAYNKLAKLADRPIHIFSRHHEMLRRLKGNATAPFLSMGSVDATLYEIYGHDFLVDNMHKFGISNAFLFMEEGEISTLVKLKEDDALGLILATQPKLHDVLPFELQKRGCPCDADLRSHISSCRQCALSMMGCMTAFAEHAIDSKGKMWRTDDPKMPRKVWPVLNYLQSSDPMTISDFIMLKRDGKIKDRKELVKRAKKELAVDPDNTLLTPDVQGYLAASLDLLRESAKKTRASIKKYEDAPKKEKPYITLHDLRWPKDKALKTKSLVMAQAHLDRIAYLMDQNVMGKAYLRGSETNQYPIAIKNGKILADGRLISRKEAEDLSFSVASRENDALYFPTDIEVANKTATQGAVGPKAKVPRVVKQLITTSDRVLDFGAGLPNKSGKLPHVETLRKMGATVTAHEFGDNADPRVHDAKALEKRYDVVYGSNVLNVQNSPSAFKKTIQQMTDATTLRGGQLVVNMPAVPRKGFLGRMHHRDAVALVRRELLQRFKYVKHAELNGERDREIFIASGKRTKRLVNDVAAPDLKFSVHHNGWYRQMESVLEKKLPNKGPIKSQLNMIEKLAKKGEFKAEELEWSGLMERYAIETDPVDPLFSKTNTGRVLTKKEIMDYLKYNRINVGEVVWTPEGTDPNYYNIPPAEMDEYEKRDDAWENYTKEDLDTAINFLEENEYISADKADGFRNDAEIAGDRYVNRADPSAYYDLFAELEDIYNAEDERMELYTLEGAEELAEDHYREYRNQVLEEEGLDPDDNNEFGVSKWGDYTTEEKIAGRRPTNYHELIMTLESTTELADSRTEELKRIISSAESDISRANSIAEESLTGGRWGRRYIDPEKRQELVEARALKVNAQQEIAAARAELAEIGFYERRTITKYENEAHWPGVKNPVLHVRFTEQTTDDGARMLFVEEIQSDWHQEGRKRGYIGKITKDQREEAEQQYLSDDTTPPWDELTPAEQYLYIKEYVGDDYDGSVSDAPFQTTWKALAMKRMVKWAVEHGYDQIGWTPGWIQAGRYPSLKEVVSEIKVKRTIKKNGKPMYAVWATKRGESTRRYIGDFNEWELDTAIGKELAEESINNQVLDEHYYNTDDFNLDLGIIGMSKFYNSILVAEVNKMFGKKTWGNARVGKTKINLNSEKTEKYGVKLQRITDNRAYLKTVGDTMTNLNTEQAVKLFKWLVDNKYKDITEGAPPREAELADYLYEEWGNGGSLESDAVTKGLLALGIVKPLERWTVVDGLGYTVSITDFEGLGLPYPLKELKAARSDEKKAIEIANRLNMAIAERKMPEVWSIPVTDEMRKKAKDLPLFSVPSHQLAPARDSVVVREAMANFSQEAITALTLREMGVPFFSDYVARHGGEGVKVKALRRQYRNLYGDPVAVKIGDETVYIGMKYRSPDLTNRLQFSSPLKKDPQIRPIADEYVAMIRNTMPPTTTGEDMETNVFDELRPEIRERIEQQGGLKKPPFMDKLKAFAIGSKNAFTRAYRHLDPAEYGALSDILRLHGEVNETSARRAAQVLTNILHGLKPKQYGAFRMAIIMDDMMRDIESGLLEPNLEEGQTYPFGFATKEEARAYRDRVFEIVEGDPAVKSAMRRRDQFNKELKEMLVENDLLNESVLEDDRYFHHQVLLYRAVTADGDEGYVGTGLGRRVQYRKKGWQLARTGSLEDYNTDYAQAEYEVIAQAFQQLETVATLKRVQAVADATERIKQIAKDRDVKEWKDVAKELGYVAWKPAPNTVWYKASTITDKIIDQIQSGDLAIEDAEFREIWMKGSDTEWWVKPEVAKTLDEYGQRGGVDRNAFTKGTALLQRTWKQFMLISPFRFLKYNINNTSGDADIAFAYRPGILRPKYLFRALKDITRMYRQSGRPTLSSRALDFIIGKSRPFTEAKNQELELAKRLGVIGSGWTVQELTELSGRMEIEEAIQAFTENPGKIASFWRGTKHFLYGRQQNLTAARENVLRLASWRYFKDHLAAGEKLYGASKRAEVDAVTDPDEKAAKLARELIGDYGNISEAGQFIRRQLIPFYSWVEVNSPRYFRLIKNLRHEKASIKMLPVAVGFKGLRLAAKMVAFMAMVSLWNRTFFPDEEEELPVEQRRQLHLILGRRSDGSVRTIRIQGAFSDLLSFVGAEDIVTDVKELKEGSKSAIEYTKETLLAAPVRFFHGLRPEAKTGYSLLAQKTFWPDPFHPRPVRDRMEEVARMWALDKPYRFVAGKPRRGDTATERLINDITSMVYYNSDPGESANYQTIRWAYDFMEKIGEDKGGGYTPSPKSNVLYYYKRALRFGDLPAAQRYINEYAEEFGGTQKGLDASIKRAHPLSAVPAKYRNDFYSVLTPHQAKVVDMAERWYYEMYYGKKSAELEQKVRWPLDKEIEPKTLNQIRLR